MFPPLCIPHHKNLVLRVASQLPALDAVAEVVVALVVPHPAVVVQGGALPGEMAGELPAAVGGGGGGRGVGLGRDVGGDGRVGELGRGRGGVGLGRRGVGLGGGGGGVGPGGSRGRGGGLAVAAGSVGLAAGVVGGLLLDESIIMIFT